MLPCILNIKGAYKCFWAIYGYSVGLSGETSGIHQIDRGACHDCSQGKLYYSRVRLSYLGLSGLFGGCSGGGGAVGVCRGMFGAPTGLFGGLLSSSGNS